MRKYIYAVLAISLPIAACSETIYYKVTMHLKVPRVYDNTQSLGYRRTQSQIISGYLSVNKGCGDLHEPEINAYDFVNKTHKVSRKNVTYGDAVADEVMWRYIGSNRTGVFRCTNVKLRLDLDPSYNIGADEPDNALIITLAGYGSSEKTIKGSVTGQIGCGCTAYGHISPTRMIDWMVSDITPLCGTFSMRRAGTIFDCK